MGPLEVQQEDGGLRHYLDGEPVHAGTVLERLKADGTWEAGRYEWSFRPDERPALYTSEEDGVFLSGEDTLRWPPR
jgi:hypothetical protein